MTAKRKLTDFIPDARNANRGTERGLRMLDDSLRKHGAGRSILVDKNNRVIAGNKTLERAVDIGLADAIVVPTDGRQLVVVQRTDIDLETKAGRELALADNRVSQVDLDFDPDVLKALTDDGVDLSGLWSDGELAGLLAAGGEFDPNAEWGGMPGFENALDAYKTLVVRFDAQRDVDAFAALVGQTITETTKAIWYPKKERADRKSVKWTNES